MLANKDSLEFNLMLSSFHRTIFHTLHRMENFEVYKRILNACQIQCIDIHTIWSLTLNLKF